METIQYPCGRNVIERVLPHRDPFVWVSRVLECDPGCSIVAELDVDPELPLFAGHFPGHPVLPGVIGFFAGIDKAKFRHQVQPGDVLTLKADIVKNSSRMVVAEVQALVGDQVAATATQKYVMAKSA